MQFDIASFAVWFLVFLFSTTCHEAAHALLAYLGGDKTAYQGGQVSLDPIPHIRREPFGMVLVPILTFVFNGWMMGWASAPYDPRWAHRYPRRQAMMSAAGPLANALLAVIAIVAIKVMQSSGVYVPGGDLAATKSMVGAASAFFYTLLQLNVILCLFNLIPVPPLDGAGVVEGLAPSAAGRAYGFLRESPLMAIFCLIAAWRVFPYLWIPAWRAVVGIL